jgi:2-iminoacetate synthase
MRTASETRLGSGPPWHLECDVERIGADYLCRIHGGDRHIGAVAVSQWGSGRATTEGHAAAGHKERPLALYAAHALCTASHRSVTCIAGIHFDALTRVQIDEIVRAAQGLVRQAARRLERRRLDEALEAPGSLLSRIRRRSVETSDEVDTFLSLPLDEAIRLARPRAATALADHFGGRVRLFAPLYLCSACSNDCVYCGFRKSARFVRTRLSIEQAVLEARYLADSGHRTLDLVTGEIATDRFVDYVCEATTAILQATAIRRINLNLGALSAEQYLRLRHAGAGGYHLYQETYAPRTYFAVHERGLKRDMAYRLDGPHRAAEAGFASIGLGVLLGLHPVRDDLAALAAHAGILTENFPRLRIGFSLPRLQSVDAACEYSAGAAVDDDTFIKAALFLRLRFPASHLTATTREPPAIRDRLFSLGVTKVSAGVSTTAGGYTLDRAGTGQFDIADPRPLREVAEAVRGSGLTVAYE